MIIRALESAILIYTVYEEELYKKFLARSIIFDSRQ